jgi:hypothetical protein
MYSAWPTIGWMEDMEPAFSPLIPVPTPSPIDTTPGWPWGPVPGTGLPISPGDLATLLDAFHKAVEAAKAAQPDCTDPDKVKLEARVAELERRLDAMAKAAAP